MAEVRVSPGRGESWIWIILKQQKSRIIDGANA
jgi:hypothetical protein